VRSEIVEDAIVLDAASSFQLLPRMNPTGELGSRRVADSVEFLVRNDWLTITGQTRIGLGARAETLLEQATVSAVT
jgi:hypothetical protein